MSAIVPSPTTRFAPSPTGLLHLGHAYAAVCAHDIARASGGRFLLRLEDIDIGRCRPEYEQAILEDLAWLGLSWDGPVWRQSERMAVYALALARLEEQDLLYPCFCTRRAIAEEVARIGGAPQGPEGPPYPGTCRNLSRAEGAACKEAGLPYALRLDLARALEVAGTRAGGPLLFEEQGFGPAGEHGTIVADPRPPG